MNKLIIVISLIISFISFGQIRDCSICSTKLLSNNQLKDKTVEELALLRNEIYARNGYLFKNSQFSSYFETQDWYNPLDDNSSVKLSSLESENINLIKKLESFEKQRREKALKTLVKLKKALSQKDDNFIKSVVSSEKYSVGILSGCEKILNKIDLDALFFNKKYALYSIRVDDGFSTHSYTLTFGKDEVVLKYGDDSNSANFGDFDDGYSTYRSESEYQIWWYFKITKKGLMFDKTEIAG